MDMLLSMFTLFIRIILFTSCQISRSISVIRIKIITEKKRKQIHSDGGKRIFLLIFVVNSIISCGSRVTRVRISRSVYSLKQIQKTFLEINIRFLFHFPFSHVRFNFLYCTMYAFVCMCFSVSCANKRIPQLSEHTLVGKLLLHGLSL